LTASTVEASGLILQDAEANRLANVLLLFSVGFLATMPLMLFSQPYEEVLDEEVATILRQSIANAGRLPRHVDVFLASICAEHLVDGLRAAGLQVIRPVQWRLHP
jgi:hypothetical protein